MSDKVAIKVVYREVKNGPPAGTVAIHRGGHPVAAFAVGDDPEELYILSSAFLRLGDIVGGRKRRGESIEEASSDAERISTADDPAGQVSR
jgi:hypothetical protein